jgi:hypothetical protein
MCGCALPPAQASWSAQAPRTWSRWSVGRTPPTLWPFAQITFGVQRGLQRLRDGDQRAVQRELSTWAVTASTSSPAPAMPTAGALRADDPQHDGGRAYLLGGHARAQTCDCRGRLCHLRRRISRQQRAGAFEFLDEFPPSLYVPGCPAHPLTFITGIDGPAGYQLDSRSDS